MSVTAAVDAFNSGKTPEERRAILKAHKYTMVGLRKAAKKAGVTVDESVKVRKQKSYKRRKKVAKSGNGALDVVKEFFARAQKAQAAVKAWENKVAQIEKIVRS